MTRCLFVGLSLSLFASVASGDDSVRAEKQIYKKTPQGALAIHFSFPPGWKKSDKRPAIVFFFGGGWRAGRVTQFADQATYLATRGMVAARADYRVLSRHKTKADKCIEDCKSAVRWLRENAGKLGINPNRIVASGGSAGGHTAAATALCKGFEATGENHKISSRPNLLVLFNPALNTARFGSRFGSDELARKGSPNHQLTKAAPPAIIYFGTNDFLLDSGKEYLAKAEKLGVKAELYLAKDQKHGFFNRSPWKERTLYLTDVFLSSHGYLTGKPTVKPSDEAKMTLGAKSGK
ncbi:MAG: alpha/beta hydrolase [Planctomycetaceae bacterium]